MPPLNFLWIAFSMKMLPGAAALMLHHLTQSQSQNEATER